MTLCACETGSILQSTERRQEAPALDDHSAFGRPVVSIGRPPICREAVTSYPIPANETERLAALRVLDILDTVSDLGYDEIAELAAQICQCPVAYIGFMDDDRMWLKSKYGLPPDFNSCPREIAFCTTTVCGTELVVSPDLREDQRFNQLPFVTGEPYLKFYCGMPLINDEGYALGTLCVMDFDPHDLAFEQIEAVRRLSHQVLTQLELRRKLIELDTAVRELDTARTEVVAEKRRTDELLANILPSAIADELKQNGKVQPKYVSSATILFADFKNFSLLAERVEPAALVGTLDQYFTAFDEIIARHGLEKIKTIGDAYMAVAGVPATSRHHPFDACLAALDIEATMARIGAQRQKLHLPSLELRIGLHTGPVISGVVGRRRITFDIWGDAVNTAALMEENGEPGRINASETVAGYVRTLFELEQRDAIRTKHGRQLEMFFLNRIRPELSRDAEGRLPNEKFATECTRLLTGFSAA